MKWYWILLIIYAVAVAVLVIGRPNVVVWLIKLFSIASSKVVRAIFNPTSLFYHKSDYQDHLTSTVEDFRDNNDTSTDFKISFQDQKRSEFSVLLNINPETNNAFVCGFENSDREHPIIIPELVIPNKVKGYTIKSIKENAFKRCPNLCTVIIPDSVTTIEDCAFYECASMTSITIPNSVTEIGKDVFKKCDALKTILIDKPMIPKEEAGVPEKVEFYSRYIGKLNELLEKNRKNPNDSEVVKLSQSIAFSPIIRDFADGIEKIEDVNGFNNALLNAMIKHQQGLKERDFGFVKYLHIFNHAGINNFGYINIYFDYSNETISIDREGEMVHNMVFDDDSLIFLTKTDVGIMGGGIVEYYTPNNRVLEPDYYPVVTLDKNNRCQPSDFIKQWFRPEDEDLDKATDYLKSLKEYISDVASSEKGKITNVFYIGNYRDDLESTDQDRDYPLWANVGIDCSKVKNKDCVKVYLEQLRKFLHRISVQIQFGLKELELRKTAAELRETAARAAVGQVSSRNFSHNFGSHVFSQLMGDDTYNNIETLALNEAYVTCYDNMEIDPGKQLAGFLQYVKNRMDYLSELSFGVSNILTAKTIYGDVFRELDHVKLLLNYISGVTSFKYKFCLKYNGKEMGEGHDVVVAFPGDVLGSQALYNILENIIRNTAKHAVRDDAGSGCETFTIEFFDGEEFPEYYCVEIDNGISEHNIDELVKRQNGYINDSILDKSNNVRTYSLGLLEIEASAAFLRQIDVAKIESYEYEFGKDDIDEYHNSQGNLIILKAIKKNNALGCRFFLQKPKEFLFVGDDWNIDGINQKGLLNLGIRFVGSAEFVQQLRKGKSFAHQFLIYNNAISAEAETMLLDSNESKTLLPLKKLKFDEELSKSVISKLKSDDKNDLMRQLKAIAWSQYYKNVIMVEQKNSANGSLEINSSVVEPDESTPMPPNQITFLDHATGDWHKKNWNNAQQNKLFEAWVENLSSHSSAKLPEFNTLSVGKHDKISEYIGKINIDDREWVRQALFTAYHERVVVIDERIQKHSKKHEGFSNEEGGAIPVGALYESTNVIFPNPEAMPLDPKQYDPDTIINIETFINNNCTNALLLIHYAILERMYKTEEAITEHLEAWSKNAKRLVVTSGRGSHSLPLPESVCFVDLSSVLYAFVANRNKYIIDYLLHQARRKNG